jgi:hypothetical protein
MPELLLSCLLSLALAQPAVQRCVGADGHVRFQDRPCAEGEEAATIELQPEPPATSLAAPPPKKADAARPTGSPVPVLSPLPAPAPEAGPMSWRCEVANGEVYYRHDACPPQISEPVALVNAAGERYATVLSHPVRAVPVSRREACRQIARGGRFGAERDQRAEPYQKRNGRDPCQ